MSTYSLNSNIPQSDHGTATPSLEQQPKLLEDALQALKQQAFHMRKSIDADNLYDALKFATGMLGELKTSQLLPKYYYQLYMAMFDEMRYLNSFLFDLHTRGVNHLASLYELVQYASNVLPRLYLMITVGSVYMKASIEYKNAWDRDHPVDLKGKGVEQDVTDATSQRDPQMAPVKEIMKDVLEMSRGVQNATRGLFLRYYLSALTRDYLPDSKEGDDGSISDSIEFVLQNFIEMNKLWVRLQHQGHSRDKSLREQERKELRLLVGSNLVRLSQLEEISLKLYQEQVLPSLLDEIVSCRDVIAQEYLLDVIIQAFPDEYHIHCLDMYLSAITDLQPEVNVKMIVISLIDRFAGYAARVRDEQNNQEASSPGIPDDAHLFDVFWEQINELIEARPEFTIEDAIALYSSLNMLALNCYPKQYEYADRVLGMVKLKLESARKADSSAAQVEGTSKLLSDLLVNTVKAYYNNMLTFLSFPSGSVSPELEGHRKSDTLGGHFTDLLYMQSFSTRRLVAHTAAKCIVKSHLDHGYLISTVDGVNFILGEICGIMVRDQIDGTIFGPNSTPQENDFKDDVQVIDWEDIVEEQNLMAQLMHVFKPAEQNYQQMILLLSAVREHFKDSGDIRVRFTFEPLVGSMIQVIKSLVGKKENEEDCKNLLKAIYSTINYLGKTRDCFSEEGPYTPLFQDEITIKKSAAHVRKGLPSPSELSLRLCLMAAKVANLCSVEDLCYEFFVEAFTVYEESISESRQQLYSIMQIISALYQTNVFGYENYETLSSKCLVHSSRLLKRADQCRGILYASHLFWVQDKKPRDEDKPAHVQPKRVLECLQKALKIADSVMDHAISVGLFVDILEKYLWYYDLKNEAITAVDINSLIQMISQNLLYPVKSTSKSLHLRGPLGAPLRSPQNNSQKYVYVIGKHFTNILQYISVRQNEGQQSMTPSIPGMDAGFQTHGGRWGDIHLIEFDLASLLIADEAVGHADATLP